MASPVELCGQYIEKATSAPKVLSFRLHRHRVREMLAILKETPSSTAFVVRPFYR